MLVKLGWAEKVVESLVRLYPKADIFTLMYDETSVWSVFPKERIHPQVFSLMSQKIFIRTGNQRLSLMFMKRSIEKLDLSDYDLVIVSSSWFAHGIKVPKTTKTIVYYHAPSRYLWDWTHAYRKDIWYDTGIRWFFLSIILQSIRLWDYEAGQQHDIILANSTTTQKRIWKYFRRTAQIVYPPVETKRFAKKWIWKKDATKYYIILSTLTEFKRIEIAIQNFFPHDDTKLWIIGDGDHRKYLEKISWDNIHFLGAMYGDKLVEVVQNSLGLIFPGEEDFWIVPIEVMAAGKPVFALQKGWLTETVIPGETGEFFTDPLGTDFPPAFLEFHEKNLQWIYTKKSCQKQANIFSEAQFHKTIKKLAI